MRKCKFSTARIFIVGTEVRTTKLASKLNQSKSQKSETPCRVSMPDSGCASHSLSSSVDCFLLVFLLLLGRFFGLFACGLRPANRQRCSGVDLKNSGCENAQ